MVVTTELVLIRHGETDWNKEHRLQGQAQPGPPLNDLGIQQTHMLCHVLQKRYAYFDAVVSSDLQRTLQTAQILAAPYQLQVQQHAGLRERQIGLLQGLTNKEAPFEQPEAWAALQSGDHSARLPGGGESLDDLNERLSETLLDIARQHPGERVLVISHGGALHATHRAARGYEAQGKVSNCSITVVTAELDSQPDTCQHLQEQCQDQPDTCQDQPDTCQDQPDTWQDQPGRQPDSQAQPGTSSGSSSRSSDDDILMHSSMYSSLPSSLGCPVDMDSSLNTVQHVDDDVEQFKSGLGLLFSRTASQGSGYCSSSCCGCCYCMGDVCEGGCIGDASYGVACDKNIEYQAADCLQESSLALNHQQQQQQQQEQKDCAVAVACGDAARAEAAAAAAKAAFGDSKVVSGKLSMLVWNDTAALFDLEAEEGVGMRAAGFGGSAREA